MPRIAAPTSRAPAACPAFAFALLILLAVPASGDPLAPSRGMASAGGNVSAGPLQLTFALGQTGGGPLTGGSLHVTAQWLRTSRAVVLDAGPPAAAAAALRFATYPNPAVERIVLRFTPHAGAAGPARIRLEIFDVSGRLVRRLADGRYSAGPHELTWDGRDTDGSRVPAGLYLCRLQDGDQTNVRRLELVH
jgi:hypothetical protein